MKFGKNSYYRPNGALFFMRNVSPVRIWTGRKYTWFWVVPVEGLSNVR